MEDGDLSAKALLAISAIEDYRDTVDLSRISDDELQQSVYLDDLEGMITTIKNAERGDRR